MEKNSQNDTVNIENNEKEQVEISSDDIEEKIPMYKKPIFWIFGCLGCGGLILVGFIAFIVLVFSVPTSDENVSNDNIDEIAQEEQAEKEKKEEEERKKAEEEAEKKKKEEQQEIEQQEKEKKEKEKKTEKENKKSITDKLIENDNVDKATLVEGRLILERNPGTVWSENSLFHTVYDLFKLMDDAFEDKQVEKVEANVITQMIDNKGNEEEESVIKFTYSKESFKELNYEKFLEMASVEEWRILREADYYYIHPGIYKNLKDKYKDNLNVEGFK